MHFSFWRFLRMGERLILVTSLALGAGTLRFLEGQSLISSLQIDPQQ